MKRKCYACRKEFTMAQLNFCFFSPFQLQTDSDYPDLLCDKCLEILNKKYSGPAQAIENYSKDALKKLCNQWLGDCNV